MAGEKQADARDARLERLAREVVRASGAEEQEASAAAASPFLYARVRASIEAERRRREEGEGWLALFAVAWRAVPALALVAVFALALFLSAGAGEAGAATADEALIGDREADIEQVVFAETRAPSSDEVLSNIVGIDERTDERPAGREAAR
ncbi:MAG TPA: hypothetical protein VJ866_23730 [Pyrinomonadaceae bacterium]|nr:hypothetical protein [Pyrinomonadaceae bacterium]